MEKSEKYTLARETLPEELRDDFQQMVEDYRYAATIRYSRPYVSYIVLADMIKAGWRRSGKEIMD